MKFSVIVPVYNTETYIESCIESVIAQDYKCWELLLVDDGSTDKSGHICDKYALFDGRIRVFHKSNSGQFEARRFGIERASGQFVVFLDSDDILATNALKVIFEKAEHYQCDMVVYSCARFRDFPERLDAQKKDDTVITDMKELCITLLSEERYNSLCIKACKRELLLGGDNAEFKNVRYGEDLLQSLEIISKSPKTVMVPDVLYYYRVNTNSVTASLRLKKYAADIVFVRSKILDFLREKKLLTSEELCVYRGVSIKLMAEGVANIARDKGNFEQKTEIFNEIKASSYYIDFLCAGEYNKKTLGNKRIAWFLFKKGYYRALCFAFSVKRLFDGR